MRIRMLGIDPPDPETRTIFAKTDDAEPAPYFVGDGHMVWLCASCDAVLLERIHPRQVQGIVFRCFACGQHNETRT